MSYPPTGPPGWGPPGQPGPQGRPPQRPGQGRPQQPIQGPGNPYWSQGRPPGGFGPPGGQFPPGPQGPQGHWGPPPEPPRKKHTGLIIAGVIAAVVVLAGAAVAAVSLSGSGDGDPVADPSTSVSATTTSGDAGGGGDEDAVQAAAEKRVQLINDQDAGGLHDMACDADSRTESRAGYEELFDRNGSIVATIDVQDVNVDGRVGKVDGEMAIDSEVGDIHWAFKKEDGEWRFCPSLSERRSSTAPSTGGDDIITG